MNPENQELDIQNEETSKSELVITEEIAKYLTIISKWGKFLSILGFAFVGLVVFGGIIMSLVFSLIPSSDLDVFPVPAFLLGFLYLVIGLVYFFPIFYLFRFSFSIDQALRLNDQDKLAKSFHFLKAHYRFIGIFIVVVMVLYAVLLVGVVAFGMFAGTGSLGGINA